VDARLILAIGCLCAAPALAQGFDHSHQGWDALLRKHVVLLPGNHASQLRYAELAKDRAALKSYLDVLQEIGKPEFDGWPKNERKAFLINAYNAFAVEKILTRYPDIRSIWDFGRIFGNPFKDDFFTLLGRRMSLDGIEHETLRRPGAYDDARVHYAVNCASIGCPMLREEAYVAGRLEQQLDEQAQRFLSDRTRNRYREGKLEVSKIFDWFKEDFEPRQAYFARHARTLEYPGGAVPLEFLDYDWTLNDFRSSSPR